MYTLYRTFMFLLPLKKITCNNQPRGLVVRVSTNREVLGSIPGSTLGIFLEGEDPRGDHGLGRLVDFRFKVPPGTTSSSITTHTSSGQRNSASWASQPQKSVTLLPCPGGRTRSPQRTSGVIRRKKNMQQCTANV